MRKARVALVGCVVASTAVFFGGVAHAQTTVLDATLTAGTATIPSGILVETHIGYDHSGGSSAGSLTPSTFSHGGTNYTVSGLYRFTRTVGGTQDRDNLVFEIEPRFAFNSDQYVTLELDGTAFNLGDMDRQVTQYIKSRAGLTWADGDTIRVKLTIATTPEAPGNLTAARGDTEATLGWDTPADGGSAITGYEYRQSADGTTWNPAAAVSWTAPTR